ncbi:hypothetical protein [Phocaeicola sp.]
MKKLMMCAAFIAAMATFTTAGAQDTKTTKCTKTEQCQKKCDKKCDKATCKNAECKKAECKDCKCAKADCKKADAKKCCNAKAEKKDK